MTSRRSGNRYPLLISRRLWDRLWAPTLFLGIILGLLWWQAGSGKLPYIQTANNLWVLFGAIVSLLIGIFALLARNMSYIQPFASHFRIVTPFLKLNVSYRRISTIHPADMVQLFPPKNQRWAQRRFLTPFYAYTALAIKINGFPISKSLLRLFFPHPFFLPQATGFVIVVADWMKLSTELDTRIGTWQGNRRNRG